MSAPHPNLPDPPADDDSEYHPDAVALRDRMAARGVTIRIPKRKSTWELPEPIEVEGDLSASEIIIRWRHAPP